MRVSLNKIREYTNIDVSTEELVDLINRRLGGVEKTIDLGSRYEKATIVRVVSAEQHPDADRLRVTRIDDAGVMSDVERDEDGYIQVVCGAPNAREGILAVWLPPTAAVPSSFTESEPFVLSSRKLRGVLSHGMLAASDELAIGSDHAGIIEIHERDVPQGIKYDELVGKRLAEVFGLDDTIIEIENKMFTHRPDLFGQLGVAREIAGIQHKKFTSPEWYLRSPDFNDATGLELEVFNTAPEVVPRFMAVVVKDVTVESSPLWLQIELMRLGSKPINNIVDITNYIMLLTAQPVHAYDYDTIRGGTLGARLAADGETVKLLNGKTYELDENDIVIADGEGPIGLAGIMGGGDSEVSNETKNIVLEVASFDMYTLRKTSMRHGVFTDALTRFNKGQSPLQNAIVLRKLLDMTVELSGGSQASTVFDIATPEDGLGLSANALVVAGDFINARLGLELKNDEIVQLLRHTEFDATTTEQGLELRVPFWRTDIEEPEDIVEEVGRLYGYERLPRELPLRTIHPAQKNHYRELAKQVRTALARAGANEVLTYSFVHEKVLKSARQDSSDAYTLSNALSPDLQYYRLSLTPSLLDKVNANIRAGHDEFALYELGKSHSKKAGLDAEGLPFEPRRTAFVYAAKNPKAGAAYFRVKQVLELLGAELGLVLEYKKLPQHSALTVAMPFDAQRSARVIDRTSGQAIGIIGEYPSSVRKAFKLPNYSAGFELLTEGLLLARKQVSQSYQPLSRYQSVERDVCFEVTGEVSYAQVEEAVRDALQSIEVVHAVTPLDLFVTTDKMQRVTVRIRLTPYSETLTGDAINSMIDTVTKVAAEAVQAKII